MSLLGKMHLASNANEERRRRFESVYARKKRNL